MKRSFKPGQSLMEVVVAMGLVVIAAVALVSTTIFTQKSARSASAQTQATKLTEESIEQIRVIRDRKEYGALGVGSCKVIALSSDPNNWLLKDCVPPGVPETIVLGNISFTRRIDISEIVLDAKKKATVIVSWQESGGTRKVENITFFSKFQ